MGSRRVELGFVTIEGPGQAWRVHRAGEGPPVVLVHGFPDLPHSWVPLVGSLVDAGLSVVVPYLRGYHPDTIVKGRPYDIDTLGRDVLGLLDVLEIDEAALVGHDWGASIVYAAERLGPERVAALVPVAIPHPGAIAPSPGLVAPSAHFVRLRLPGSDATTRARGFAYLDTLYRRWSPQWSGADRNRCLAEVKAAFGDPAVLHAALDYYRALRPPSRDAARHRPACPGLHVLGDHPAALIGAGRRTVDEFWTGPAEFLLVEGTGHWPHLEAESRVTAAITEFLTSVPTWGR